MLRSRQGGAPRGAAAGVALLAVLLAAEGVERAVAQIPPDLTVTIPTLCSLLASANLYLGNPTACSYVEVFMKAVLSTPADKCDTPGVAGLGTQRQPITKPAATLPKSAQRKSAPQPIGSRGSPDYFTGKKLTQLLNAEGPTYMWFWDAIRNLKTFFPCSKAFGGSATGYLVPEGWEAVGGTVPAGASGPATPGIYNWQVEGQSYPVVAALKQSSSRQLVFVLRGASAKADWKVYLIYQRVKAFVFPGEAFTGNSFDGSIHKGFADGFATLWPDIQALLKSEVVSPADRKAAPKTITFAGQSLGGSLAQLLGFAAKRYLQANKKGNVKIGVISIGSPALGDTEFTQALSKLVNMRRIVFENDLYSILPCNSTTDDLAKAMPACANTVVPTPNPDGTTYWSGYQQALGGVYFTAAQMPVQKEAWAALATVALDDVIKLGRDSYSGHVCSYNCLFRQFVTQPDNANTCLLSGSQDGYSLCSGTGG